MLGKFVVFSLLCEGLDMALVTTTSPAALLGPDCTRLQRVAISAGDNQVARDHWPQERRDEGFGDVGPCYSGVWCMLARGEGM